MATWAATRVLGWLDGTLVLAAGSYGRVKLKLGTAASPTPLQLSGGTYELDTLDLGLHSRVECTAACEVRIKNKLLAGLDAAIGPAAQSGLSAKEVGILVEGVNGTGLERAGVMQFRMVGESLEETRGWQGCGRSSGARRARGPDGTLPARSRPNGTDGSLSALPRAATIGLSNEVRAQIFTPYGTLWIGAGSTVLGIEQHVNEWLKKAEVVHQPPEASRRGMLEEELRLIIDGTRKSPRSKSTWHSRNRRLRSEVEHDA